MSRKQENEILTATLEYYEMGFSVIPVRRGEKKEPAVKSLGRYKIGKADVPTIRRWFRKDEKNVGILCGGISGGLTILDFDEPQKYELFKAQNPNWAEKLPTVKTGRGYHVYLRTDMDKGRAFEKFEIIAKGYAVAPPSIHHTNVKYKWLIPINGEIPLLRLDDLNLTGLTEETEVIQEIEEIQAIKEEEVSSSDNSKLEIFGLFDLKDPETYRLVQQALEATLPRGEGQRNKMVFQYARYLKGIPELAGCKVIQLRKLVREWFERGLTVIRTEDFETTWGDFIHAWENVAYPKAGGGSLVLAIERAYSTPRLDCEEEYVERMGKRMGFLIRVCYELQNIQGDNPFFLASRSAADILHLSPDTANKRLKILCAEGILELVEKGHAPDYASRFKFCVESRGLYGN